MYIEDYIDEKFKRTYSEKIQRFIVAVNDFNLKNIPEPFIPVYGKTYSTTPVKIMFMGWETRNAHSLLEFVDCASSNIDELLYWFNEEFDEFEFLYWRSNFGTDFWTFNLKFLAHFYDLKDWKELTKNPEDHETILSSFAWANCDSIERYEVTAQKHGVVFSDWKRVKDASIIFDNPQLIFGSLEPDIVILLHWHKEEDWLLNGIEVLEEAILKPHLWWYKCRLHGREFQIFWTYHPRGMPKKKIVQDEIISEIISKYQHLQAQSG